MLVLLVISILLNGLLIQAIPSISFFYPNNLTESTCIGDSSWTKWFNTFKPNTDKEFDQEFLSVVQANNDRHICKIPKGIQAQTVSVLQTDIKYAVTWKMMNGITTAFISRTPGVDFQVRFCCKNSDFITTTTTTPRPIDSNTCGQAQIQSSFQLTRIFGGSRAIPHSWPWVSPNLEQDD